MNDISAARSDLAPNGKLRVGTPKGHDAGAKYLCEFVEDVKATGLVARIIEKNGVCGVSVAPIAADSVPVEE